MKKNLFKIALITSILLTFFSSCDRDPTYYTVSYSSEYGTAPEDKQFISGYLLTADDLPELTAEGYTFKGWDKEIGDEIIEDTVITASWEKNPVIYTITYVSEFGEQPEPKKVEEGYELTADDLQDLSQDGYTFKGWDKTVGTKITADITITASWEKVPEVAPENNPADDSKDPAKNPVKYTITYETEKGTKPTSKSVEEGYVLKAADLPALTNEDYDFVGWSKKAGDKITADTKITATWKIKQVKLTYSTAYGAAPKSKTVDKGYALTKEDLPALTDEDYNFTGWDKAAGDKITADTTITASWKIKQVKLTYSTAYGTAPETKTVDKGYALKAADLPALTNEDYDFTGWDKAAGDKITADTTITASWKIKQVKLTYSTAYGTAPETKTVDKGYALTAEDLPTLTDKYYDLVSWNKNVGDKITADTAITASWQIRSCTVTYSSTLTGDGTKQIPATFTKDAGYKLTWEDVPCLGKDSSGQLFVGWGKSFGDEITNDITLTAEWQDEVYLSFGNRFEAILNDADESLSIIFQKEPYEGDYKETYDCSSTSNSYYTSYLTNDNKLIISGNGHKIVFPVYSNFLFSNNDNGGKISSFTFNNDCITSYVEYMACMFSNCSSITSIDMSNLDTSNVTNMGQMFECCENLKTVNIGKTSATNMYGMFSECRHIEKVILDTSSATDMERMFFSCQVTESIDISGFDTSSATKMKYMFSSCNNLKTLDLSGFNTSNVTTMECMFNQCLKLETLDLSGFDTQKVENMEEMFQRCSQLKTVDLSSFDTQKVTNMKRMFTECTNLETIYASDTFTVDDAETVNMFWKCTSLVGGNGTKCNDEEDSNGKAHACIDASKTPGYFTRKQ